MATIVCHDHRCCGLAQVIPTVGVSGDGAEGEKKVAVQLKHFRNLVDENASKVRANG